jgi:hypothetical protein
VSLSFVAPAQGSSPIQRYEVSVNVGSAQTLSPERVVSDLDENATYSFRVRACNATGCGLWSPKSNSINPLPPISAPAAIGDLGAAPGNQSVTLNFTVPTDGGSSITGYDVSLNGGAAQTLSSNKVVSGLTNGTPYTFRVRACNVAGCAEWSNTSNSVTPRTVPAAPSVGSSVSGTTISWSWNTPATNGSPITGFEVRLDGNVVQGGLSTSFSRGFGYSETHTVTVAAVNAAGTGPTGSSTNRTVTPPPSASAAKGPQHITSSCTVSACAYVDATLNHYSPNSVVNIQCWGSFGGASAFYSYNVTTDGNGYSHSDVCFYGYPGTQAWIVAGGVESNHVGW